MSTFQKQQAQRILNTYGVNTVQKPSDELIQKAQELSETPKFKKVMSEWKAGTLKTSTGVKVEDQNQALAIAFSEAQKVEKSIDLDIEKGKKAMVGEKRTHGGVEKEKQADGSWKEVKKENGGKVDISGYSELNGRYYKTKRFNSVSATNNFLEKNPEWGVLKEDGNIIHVAKNDDKGFDGKDKFKVLSAQFNMKEVGGKQYIVQGGSSDFEYIKERAKKLFDIDIEKVGVVNNPSGSGTMVEIKIKEGSGKKKV